MKKIFLFAALCVATMFASCGNSTNANASGNDTDTVAVDTIDSVAADSTVCPD